jgi:hypothetical protein
VTSVQTMFSVYSQDGWYSRDLFPAGKTLSLQARGLMASISVDENLWSATGAELAAALGIPAFEWPGPDGPFPCDPAPDAVIAFEDALEELEACGFLVCKVAPDPAWQGMPSRANSTWVAWELIEIAARTYTEPDPATVAPRGDQRPTCLYRHFDEGGKLLYIGITHNSQNREEGHERSALWYGLSRRRVETWYPNRAEAEAAEIQAIKKRQPLFNVDHNEGAEARRRVQTYLEERGLAALWDLHSRKTGKLRRRLPAPKR